jgi:hypothetical protein
MMMMTIWRLHRTKLEEKMQLQQHHEEDELAISKKKKAQNKAAKDDEEDEGEKVEVSAVLVKKRTSLPCMLNGLFYNSNSSRPKKEGGDADDSEDATVFFT